MSVLSRIALFLRCFHAGRNSFTDIEIPGYVVGTGKTRNDDRGEYLFSRCQYNKNAYTGYAIVVHFNLMIILKDKYILLFVSVLKNNGAVSGKPPGAFPVRGKSPEKTVHSDFQAIEGSVFPNRDSARVPQGNAPLGVFFSGSYR